MYVNWCECMQSERVDSRSSHFLSVRNPLLWQHSRETAAASSLATSLDCRRTWMAFCGWLRQRPRLAARREAATPTSHVDTVGRSQTAMATVLHSWNWHSRRWLGCGKCCTLPGWRKNVKEEEIIRKYWTVDMREMLFHWSTGWANCQKVLTECVHDKYCIFTYTHTLLRCVMLIGRGF